MASKDTTHGRSAFECILQVCQRVGSFFVLSITLEMATSKQIQQISLDIGGLSHMLSDIINKSILSLSPCSSPSRLLILFR